MPDLLTIESPIHLELVRVPAGEFLMGSDPTKDSQAYEDEKPQHRIYLPDFYIGKYPVTNAQYAALVKATQYRAPGHWPDGKIPARKGDHPVVNVSWHDAVAFCAWLSQTTGKTFRLPTETEWEKAARGADERIYPWGNKAPDAKLCNFGMNVGDTTPVGQYPAGVSSCGALDMAGNVWEWTLSLHKPYPYQAEDGRNALEGAGPRVLRGGAFYNDARHVRCTVRNGFNPDFWFRNLGFRVVCVSHHS